MRAVIVAAMVAAVVSTTVGFALGQASNPAPASAAGTDSRTLRDIRSQLYQLNLSVGRNPYAGLRAQIGDVRELLHTICIKTGDTTTGCQ